jgi:cytochrome c-type protein NapB
MNKHLVVLFAALAVAHVAAADAVQTLRGAPGIMDLGEGPAPEHQAITPKPKARDFDKQPPLIPHNVQGVLIQTRVNMCLACHARRTESRSNSAKLPDSHFLDREGPTASDTVAPRRWFCNQCHVPQMDVAPLVQNTYRASQVSTKKK